MFMTLLVGLAVQWTGTQQIAFIWAGVMHVLALALFWFWFKGRFVQVNVDAGLDKTVMHEGCWSPVESSRFSALLYLRCCMAHWENMVSIVKLSGALQAAMAAGGFVVIGVALLYAGLPRRFKPRSEPIADAPRQRLFRRRVAPAFQRAHVVGVA